MRVCLFLLQISPEIELSFLSVSCRGAFEHTLRQLHVIMSDKCLFYWGLHV